MSSHSDEKKSSLWWAAVHKGHDDIVMDPDGWDRTNWGASLLEPITYKEYIRRVDHSTTMGRKGSNFESFYREVVGWVGIIFPPANDTMSAQEQVLQLENALQNGRPSKGSFFLRKIIRWGKDNIVVGALIFVTAGFLIYLYRHAI